MKNAVPKVYTLLSVGINRKNNTVLRLIDNERNEVEVPINAVSFAQLAEKGARVYNEK